MLWQESVSPLTDSGTAPCRFGGTTPSAAKKRNSAQIAAITSRQRVYRRFELIQPVIAVEPTGRDREAESVQLGSIGAEFVTTPVSGRKVYFIQRTPFLLNVLPHVSFKYPLFCLPAFRHRSTICCGSHPRLIHLRK